MKQPVQPLPETSDPGTSDQTQVSSHNDAPCVEPQAGRADFKSLILIVNVLIATVAAMDPTPAHIELGDVDRAKRELEEANKRKRQQLLQAIAERKAKSVMEQRNLNMIQVGLPSARAHMQGLTRLQNELAQLDISLSADVSIIRSRVR